jgi:hypothetical protein
MRLTRLILAVIMLCGSGPAFAQEWTEYINRMDRFTTVFPGQPTVQEITWPSEYGMVFPGRVYAVQQGPSRYSVTVIDYTDAEKKYSELKKPESFQQSIYWQIDIMASIQFAATKFRQREGAKVTYDAWHYIDLVEGHQLQLTNADQSRTFVAIYLHENRLYIVEATVPRGAAQPGLFQQNISFLDEKGGRTRYDAIYSNRLPPVTLGRGGPGPAPGAGGGGGRGGRGGGRGGAQ